MDDLINNNQENGETTHHIVKIPEADGDWTSIESKINQRPKLLNETAGKESCCIFRLPKSLVSTNEKAYQPQIVSVGPYHHGEEHLKMVQEHKWRFLRSYLSRMKQQPGVVFRKLFHVIASHEVTIREAYSETINICSRDLIEMMILDGCFIIELFYKVHRLDSADQEPILSMSWILPFIARDFLKLQNQIPFFVLEILFEQTTLALGKSFPSLKILTLGFFNSVLGRPVEVLQRYEHLTGKHILDLFRLSLIPPDLKKTSNSADVSPIQSAEKLHLFGIRFEPRDSTDSFLDVKFDNGLLQIPTLTLDDFCSSLLQNCVAFEQCYQHCSNHFTTYATFMGCLINTPSDAGFLRGKNIIDNYLGANEQVAYFFNNLGKDMLTDINESYLTELFEKVNKYSSKACLELQRDSKHSSLATKFKWSFTSVHVASFFLIVLTMIQVLLVIRPSPMLLFLRSAQSK